MVVLSNHITWNVSSTDPAALPRFVGFVNGNLSKELGRLHDWPGPMWGRPHRPISLVDEARRIADVVRRLDLVVENIEVNKGKVVNGALPKARRRVGEGPLRAPPVPVRDVINP